MAIKSKSGSGSKLRSRELKGPSVLLLMVLSPLGLGASCDDDAVVGDECVVGSKDAKCGGGDAGSGNGDGAGGGDGEGNVCGGLRGGGDADCAAGEYCHYPVEAMCGAADATGVCEKKPDACDLIYSPVCGCDDKTYENACAAASKGVSVAATGACEAPPASGKCGSRGLPECPDGQFCQWDPAANCGASDAPGTCVNVPQACDALYDPVCGCDGMTYGNSCEASSFGVSVASDGPCSDEPPSSGCGGLDDPGCGSGEFCDFPPSAMCGAADGAGTCTKKPQGCTKEYDPVCGCDDTTYGNACMAASAGVSVLHTGECEASGGGDDCGGLAGLPCTKDEYCNYAPDDLCGAADATGKCTPRPENCIEIYAPVCGCDGMTYGNDCMAAMNGVSVVSEGECN